MSQPELELVDFLEKIKKYNYIKIKSQTANHYHIFFKKSRDIEKPFKISNKINIWDDWAMHFNLAISLGADLPSETNGRSFEILPECIDELPIEQIKKEG